jgi:hypothetical protein
MAIGNSAEVWSLTNREVLAGATVAVVGEPTSTEPTDPLLGLASSEQLIRELIARWTIPATYSGTQRALMLAEILGGLDPADREYRTVDHD